MPRTDYKRCKVCGRHAQEVEWLSHTRLCRDCAHERALMNHVQLKTHSGQWFHHWRRAMAASVGAELLDEPPGPP